jgi:hypothetical protein
MAGMFSYSKAAMERAMKVQGVIQSQSPVVERAIETSALMMGSDRSRGYCLEMICADFLAGANLDNGNPASLLFSMTRFFRLLPGEQRETFMVSLREKAS